MNERIRGQKPSRSELMSTYHNNLSLQKTGDVLGVSKKTILNWMNFYEIPRFTRKTRRRLHDPVRRYIKLGGYTTKEVATALDVSDGTINAVCRDIGKAKAFDTYHNGHILTWNGYRMINKPSHPLSDSKGYVREHRLVMEDYLNRYLDEQEVVHHIDEDKLNNSIDNLELCDKSTHTSYHSKDIV